jgi:hypothetical protein
MELNFETVSSLTSLLWLRISGLFANWMFIGLGLLGLLELILGLGLSVFIGLGGIFDATSIFVSCSESFSA